ncbi:MAG: DUF3500 domain-containing protein, partial [Gemmatimonadetes bacterium]|nr:DUF3500 domain-containing protein [Gemmatimonadota bacterium]
MSRQLKTVGAGAALLTLTLSAWVTLDTERAPMSTGNESTGEEIAEAASRFLETLESDQRDRATYDLSTDERFNWNFVPTARNGLPLKDMTLGQRTAAHRLLQATLSSQGYHKANAIIELERILGILEGRPERRDPEQYFVTIFGTPSA